MSEYVKISIISSAYKLLVTNLSHFEMLSCSFLHFSVNPLIPKSDQHLISPFSIIPESNIKVMRINEGNDNQLKNLLIVKQIPLARTSGLYREQYGEYAY